MLAWILYVIMVSAVLSISALFAERSARLYGLSTRWIWIAVISLSLLVPTVISSISFQAPDIFNSGDTQPPVVLRENTTSFLSPVTWIAGSTTPPIEWRDNDPLLKNLWLAMSASMLIALIASGAMVWQRSKHWQQGNLAGVNVYLTESIGPAVVGLIRPRIVIPAWVTQANKAEQTAIIAHEKSHLQAGDPKLFTFALGLLVFMPWNLPLWWQLRRLRHAIEIDCDARVVNGGIDVSLYGETLITASSRRSTYIGAVAAMSESSSFLEQRIRAMTTKHTPWSRLGATAFLALSFVLTAVAAQVSPPIAEHVPLSASTTKPEQRSEITLSHDVLDRYVGVFRLNDTLFMTITRENDKLIAQLTGQPAFEIFAENETDFFWKVVDARLHFDSNGEAPATTATLLQNGQRIGLTRTDQSAVFQAKRNLEAKVRSQTASPGTEAALRRLIISLAEGKPIYDEMETALANAVKTQLPNLTAMSNHLGSITSITFSGVGDQGWDNYKVAHENGTMQWRILLAENGKIQGALVLPNY